MHNGEEAIQLTELSRKFHGMLMCVKHAIKLGENLARRKVHIPWVLMTDLRGLVPCMKVLGGATPPNPPMLMVVHCENHRQVTRALFHTTQWKPACPVLQNKDCTLVTIGSPRKIMLDLIRKQLGPFGIPWLLRNRDCGMDLPKSVANIPRPMAKQLPLSLHDSDSWSMACAVMSNMSRSTDIGQKPDPIMSCADTSPADPYIGRLMQTMTQNDLKDLLDAAVPRMYHD